MTKKKYFIVFSLLMILLLLYQLISLKEKNLSTHPLLGMVIVLDPGHGGKDNGAEGPHTTEKALALKTAKKLKAELTDLGATVYLTREDDTFISLKKRVAFAEKKGADLFISIHYNSSPSEEPYGITTYYYHEENDTLLATTIQKSLIEKAKTYNRGALFGDYLVLRDNHLPSILLELGFLSNKVEEEQVNSATYQQQLVEGVCDGIITYRMKKEVK